MVRQSVRAGAALTGGIEGAELVHDPAEVFVVGDGDHRAGPVTPEHRRDVRQLRPPLNIKFNGHT